ncbi:hypothetical protein G3N56_02270 [Desulfovibrio sulfodismutans]|uniref:Uncharacterized protein n=1 Tax=Desulfolutivibrio sulfodismutans TaxID=63561 RepID=A0A7K3NH91_9BACT|nr:hypothetical protein [Desulfolutivibrio sulfodismutans]QLA11473.1 hypothetical protein GD606_03865 [Desulfolutivibrio sulfodismutans DSM 3696]
MRVSDIHDHRPGNPWGDGSESQAAALNDAGVVVGWSGTATGDIHAFRYENGMMTYLGVLSVDSNQGRMGGVCKGREIFCAWS